MRSVLLTGGTGAIGSALAPLLLEEPDTSVHLLIRARDRAHLAERLGQLHRFWGMDPNDPTLKRRVRGHAGDVALPRLGLDEAAHDALVREVTHVIHCAGNVRLNQSMEAARRDAVDPATAVLRFAGEAGRRGRLQKLEYVSTVGVAGRMSGLVPERPLQRPREFRNTYEAAKAEAEDAIVAAVEAGLPATVHRPSMVVGDSATGRIIHFQVFYHLCELLSGRQTYGIMPDVGEMRLDIVPVDYVARAILISARQEAAAGRILHLCSGPREAILLTDLADRVRAELAARGERLSPRRPVSRRWLRRALPALAWFMPARSRRRLQTVPFFLDYLDEPQVFDTSETERFLQSAGLTLPPVDAYLDRLLTHHRRARAEEPAPTETMADRPATMLSTPAASGLAPRHPATSEIPPAAGDRPAWDR